LAASYEISDSVDKGQKSIVIPKIEKDSSLLPDNQYRYPLDGDALFALFNGQQ